MFYITDGCTRYYAGKCCSDNRTPVWKGHHTRALPFNEMKEAIDFAKSENIFFLGVEYIVEGEL